MNATKAGRVNGIKETSKPKKARLCVHQLMVGYHYNEKAQPSGNLVCRECGAVIPDPVNVLGRQGKDSSVSSVCHSRWL